jgi:hypothetical protein
MDTLPSSPTAHFFVVEMRNDEQFATPAVTPVLAVITKALPITLHDATHHTASSLQQERRVSVR